MGFLGRLFGKNSDSDSSNPNDDANYEHDDSYEYGEGLSESDAEDIYMSSGQDPDYDFRPSGYNDDDEYRNEPIPDDFDADKQVGEYIEMHPNDAIPEPSGAVPEFDEANSYVFICGSCEGRGYVIVPDPFASQAFTPQCDYCYGTGENELDGWEAEERLDDGEVPLRMI